MDKRKRITAAALLSLLILAIGVWWFGFRKDQQVESVRQLQADAFNEKTRDLPEEQRREKFRQFREAYGQLSESQRREIRKEQSRGMQGRMTGQIHTYFELPNAKRIAFLDKQINEMEKRRRESAKRGNSGRERGPGSRGGTESRGRGSRETKPSEGDREDRRDRRKRGYLDGTTPQQRAEMAEFMDALRERREERGLPEFRGRRRHAKA